MHRVTVGVDPPYDIVIGNGALGAVGDVLGDRRRVAIVSQAGVASHHASALLDGLGDAEVFLMGDGEEAKTLASVEDLARRMAHWGLARDDAIVALGGGVVGDVAGFTAATYHRGITIVHAPTTLLAMVDAAIGGKTAVNLPEGKNLLGAFHQPAAVLADVTTLATLPEREYRSGMGEVAKYALMGDVVAGVSGMGELAAGSGGSATGGMVDGPGVVELVARAAAIKAAVVTADPQERTGLRATLNYGHTLAHALETDSGNALTHGEAVAVGLVFALRLAEGLERLAPEVVTRSVALVGSLGLPTRVPSAGADAGADADGLIALMRRDKKARGGLTFILDGPNGLERVDDPSERLVRDALVAVGVGKPAGMGD